jgi:hypothetical protein
VITHRVKVSPSRTVLPKSDPLAWKIALVAAAGAQVDPAAGETPRKEDGLILFYEQNT